MIESALPLLDALKLSFPDSSKRTLQNWVKEGRVYVDGEVVVKLPLTVQPGQSVTLGKKEVKRSCFGMDILYEDRWMVVIDKPAGLLSVPTDNGGENALDYLRAHYKSPSIFAVHRIDKETSGVLVFARGTLAESKFDKLFETHSLTREYLAIVEGRMSQEKGTWESFLMEKDNFDVVTTTEQFGKKAITHYEVYRRSKLFSYLRLRLETGRKHQIRVHCHESGHVVIGDKRYGSTLNPISRMGLHAKHLAFVHPFTKKKLSFSSPIPAEFERLGASLS